MKMSWFYTLCALPTLALASSDLDQQFANAKELCPQCIVVGQRMTQVLHEQCQKPYTKETWDYVLNEQPTYAYLLAVGHYSPKVLPVYLEAMEASVDCEDSLQWMTRTREWVQTDEFQVKQLNALLDKNLPHQAELEAARNAFIENPTHEKAHYYKTLSVLSGRYAKALALDLDTHDIEAEIQGLINPALK